MAVLPIGSLEQHGVTYLFLLTL